MGDARHRRLGRHGRDDELTSTALRRLQWVTSGPATGWVPRRPSPVARADASTEPVQPLVAVDGAGPPARRSVRIAPASRALGGLALLVALAVATALVAWWLARPREQPLPPRGRTVGAPLQAGTAEPGPPADAAQAPAAVDTGRLFVHVVGAVRDPGVVELPPGSRVTDAVAAAGGVTRAAASASVNLARPVVDGEQVVVLRRGDPAASTMWPGAEPAGSGAGVSEGSTGSPAGPAGPVDLNSASLDQLDALPGIGPVLAQRILDWRTAHGRFSSVDELGVNRFDPERFRPVGWGSS